MTMKVIALVILAATTMASSAMAGDGNGRGHGNGGRGWGWNSGLNVFVDVPMTGAAAGAQEDPRRNYCREARHSCFGQWGVDEPGYGRCMRRSGC